MIDLKTIDSATSILAFLFGFAALTLSWLTRGSKTNSAEIRKIRQENEERDERIRALETKMENLPTKDDFHRFDMKLSELGGNMETLSARLEGVDRVARRIDDFLLNTGVK